MPHWGHDTQPLDVAMLKNVEIKLRLSEKLCAQLDESRFEGRFRSRNAAIVRLLQLAFEAESDREPGLFDHPQ